MSMDVFFTMDAECVEFTHQGGMKADSHSQVQNAE